MEGGGLESGLTYGGTDDFGMNTIYNTEHVYDFHATIPHLLGLHHFKLTYRHNSRDVRLTDVFGNVVHDIIG